MSWGIDGSSGTSVKSIRLKFCTPKIILSNFKNYLI